MPSAGNRTSRVGIVGLVIVLLIVLALRHDYWNWDTPGHLLFGFLPVGLWWQALVSILASIMMWLMVRFAWPGHLEREAVEAERLRLAGHPLPTKTQLPTPPPPPDPGSPR